MFLGRDLSGFLSAKQAKNFIAHDRRKRGWGKIGKWAKEKARKNNIHKI